MSIFLKGGAPLTSLLGTLSPSSECENVENPSQAFYKESEESVQDTVVWDFLLMLSSHASYEKLSGNQGLGGGLLTH